jgi:hypothetical protein
MNCIKKYNTGGKWPPGKPKMDKSCKGPKAWGGGQPDNSPGQSRSGQQAGSLGTKPQFDRSRMVKPDKPNIIERIKNKRGEKKAAKKQSARNLDYGSPRFL